MTSDEMDALTRWHKWQAGDGIVEDCTAIGDDLAAELEKCRVELEIVRNERDHAKYGCDTLNDLLNQSNRELAACRARIRRVEALLEHWTPTAIPPQLLRAALTAPASDEAGECRECKGTGRVTYPNPPGVEYPCPSCTDPPTASASSPAPSEAPLPETPQE